MVAFKERERQELLARTRALSEEGLSRSEISRRLGKSRWLVTNLQAELGMCARPTPKKPGGRVRAKAGNPVRSSGGQLRATVYLSEATMALLQAEAELQEASISQIQKLALDLYLRCARGLREGGMAPQPVLGFRSMFPSEHPLASR